MAYLTDSAPLLLAVELTSLSAFSGKMPTRFGLSPSDRCEGPPSPSQQQPEERGVRPAMRGGWGHLQGGGIRVPTHVQAGDALLGQDCFAAVHNTVIPAPHRKGTTSEPLCATCRFCRHRPGSTDAVVSGRGAEDSNSAHWHCVYCLTRYRVLVGAYIFLPSAATT